MSDIASVIVDFLERHRLTGASGIVAVSGGPDSVCLAGAVRELSATGIVSRLTLAHLNHQLRGAESDADEAFVAALAGDWGLHCRTAKIDVAALARERGDNLEQTARDARYAWLAQIARAEGARWVATGHSADDQAETVLFRLLRGSGLQGLSGMAPLRDLAPGIDLIRPFLEVRRTEILAFLGNKRQSYREDSTNSDLRLRRNRLRHELMPFLRRDYNPQLVEVLCRLAEQAREAQAEINAIAARLFAEAELPHAGAMAVLAIEPLAKANRHLRREVFRLLWRREGWPEGSMSYEAWDRLAELVNAEAGACDLPGGVCIKRVGKVLQALRNAENAESAEKRE